MDRLTRNVLKYITTLTLGILIGMVIGSISFSIFISYRIDEYLKEITYLNTIIEDKDVRLKKLEESINNRKFILEKIGINLVYEGDEIDKLTLEKHIKQKYSNLIGKEVRTIDIEMVAEVIDNRIMKIEDEEFKLKVEKVLLAEELKIWVKVN
ncbi:hypothetical protein [Sporosalibacterium faouarense]|uniref:hypothetical protein n=1 Tax=Sporosalibacterium faouarense TaxID=516123 RepID=UPI00141D2744|nr:hypothetical protein [Sporosalibacterium faouarense]MTI48842.1 hypothetical protein [Bacillota bacterium]